ncbi:nucleotide disphospho-sugar-binding domain-containing protein [Prauserella cavernicola]|uniref:DUF1205 domain-containing protein n=1 Tax=Prauserella cavernicola TaxID=2800127 RepID=A0A934QPR6_9PSEU|nr:nucleotide disphospho-sugar-binding domain-containing protein [Prauserella cavernicola]MBK1785947.1 DUF1205 domain-containing protein [Prauserella cavernicola]
MRVLLVSAPLLGHAFPLVPLTLALREAGHDVLVAAGGPALAVREAGVEVADVASGVRLNRAGLRIALTHPRLAKAEAAGAGGLDFVSRLFATAGEQMSGEVVSLAGQWKPDLVVHEPLAVAGAIAARHQGVPAAVHDTSLFDSVALTAAIAARLRLPLPKPAAVLRTTPPSLGTFETPDVRTIPLRPVPYSGKGEVPAWLAEQPAVPRILVSRSTVAGPGGGRMMAALARAAEGVEAEVVLVRPSARLTRKPLPPNVSALGWVPIPEVLPTCAAIVHHGGAGTLLAALAAGVPQLIEPGAGDRAHHARLVSARGAGLSASARDVTPELLTRLVTDETVTRAATQVRAEIATLPTPTEVAQQLPHLT